MQLSVPSLGYGSACRIPLGDKQGALETILVLAVQVHAAVPKFPVVNLALLGPFTGNLLDTLKFLALTFAPLNFLNQSLRRLGILMQIIVQLLLEEITHEQANRLSFGSHRKEPNLVLVWDSNTGS